MVINDGSDLIEEETFRGAVCIIVWDGEICLHVKIRSDEIKLKTKAGKEAGQNSKVKTPVGMPIFLS